MSRETTLAVYGMAVVGMVAYTFTFNVEIIAVTFVTAGAVGYVISNYTCISFDLIYYIHVTCFLLICRYLCGLNWSAFS